MPVGNFDALGVSSFSRHLMKFDDSAVKNESENIEIDKLESHYKGLRGFIVKLCDVIFNDGKNRDEDRKAVLKLTVPSMQVCNSEADVIDRLQAYKHIKDRMPAKYEDSVALRIIPSDGAVRVCLEIKNESPLRRELNKYSKISDEFQIVNSSEELSENDVFKVKLDKYPYEKWGVRRQRYIEKIVKLADLKLSSVEERKAFGTQDELKESYPVDWYLTHLQNETVKAAIADFVEVHDVKSSQEIDTFCETLISEAKQIVKEEREAAEWVRSASRNYIRA
ncbi:hypothetical protein JQC92_05475 [Shewanella sp. 202IG2-18]|uniref:hypothetical protein n=1 Tax=Parashewanella hymeniacidonis TaxID=2807618 RepID=UPI001962004C|nr:hypothetical protein [Parashewanella hymeniacidonis]MBM7071488.1 hypothetical protein [Parashewanella hymeniacidonis]